MKKVLLGMSALLFFAVFVIYNLPERIKITPDGIFVPLQVFVLPQSQLACFELELKDEAKFSNWNIYQPTRIKATGSNITISNNTFHTSCELE